MKLSAAPVSRQLQYTGPNIPTNMSLVPRGAQFGAGGGTKPGLTAAGTIGAAAGGNAIVDALTQRDRDALNTQVQ